MSLFGLAEIGFNIGTAIAGSGSRDAPVYVEPPPPQWYLDSLRRQFQGWASTPPGITPPEERSSFPLETVAITGLILAGVGAMVYVTTSVYPIRGA